MALDYGWEELYMCPETNRLFIYNRSYFGFSNSIWLDDSTHYLIDVDGGLDEYIKIGVL